MGRIFAFKISKMKKKNSKQFQVRFKDILNCISVGIYGKGTIMSKVLLCAIAGESMFILGPPGTAKSLIARRLKSVFKDAKAFEYLMSRFSTPDEIFGPVSISKLKNEDKYERLVEDYLPDASVVFLDEIWKAGPAIQNSLLTAINERVFKNGTSLIKLPMKVLIAASNELPEEDQGLEALWDRFLIRVVSNSIDDESLFFDMVKNEIPLEIELPDNLVIHEDEYNCWQMEIKKILIPDDVCSIVSVLRKQLIIEGDKEGHQQSDFYVSDRRWKKVFRLMQTSAFLNGRDSVNITDLLILYHCLWNDTEHIPIIISCVSRSILWQSDEIIMKVESRIDKVLNVSPSKKTSKQIAIDDNLKLIDFFYYELNDYSKEKCLIVASEYKRMQPGSETKGILVYDEKKKAWIIHVMYVGNPFDSVLRSYASTVIVRLKHIPEGIIIDGKKYFFQKNNDEGVTTTKRTCSPTQFAKELYLELDDADNCLLDSLSRFEDGANLLNSKDEVDLLRQEALCFQKRIDILRDRLSNKI